jgi:SsrA-binding protein
MSKDIATNRKAYHDYHVLESYEAGLVLTGTEVKALREGRANLKDSHARIKGGEVFLYNMHIGLYSHGGYANHDPLRARKLLLKRKEITRLIGKVEERGNTLVPLKLYFKNGRAKVELALVRGKKLYDKREDIKRRDAAREMDREFRDRRVRTKY